MGKTDSEKIEDIHRAIYGDPPNKVEGMLDKVNKHDTAYRDFRIVFRNPRLALPVMYVAAEIVHKIFWALIFPFLK